VRGGIYSPHDHQVDPRALSRALAAALQRAGGTLRTGTAVRGLVSGGVELASGERIAAGQVVVAAGAWIPELDGLPDWLPGALRPVKGQILRLRGERLLSHIVRLPRAYLLPRDDGRMVIGASSEDQGFDQAVTAGAVLDMLRYAYEGVPGITELELYETFASLRPGSRDNLPLIGPAGDRLWVACGHYRNGILLAPATADLLSAAICGEPVPDLQPFDPGRFAARPEALHADHAER
jgi:glycine oxidase